MKKLIIIIISVVAIVALSITSFATTTTDKLPNSESALPINYISLRTRGGDNKLYWTNHVDTRVGRESVNYDSEDVITYSVMSRRFTWSVRTIVANTYASMRIHTLEAEGDTSLYNTNSYVHFELADFGLNAYNTNYTRSIDIQLLDFDGLNLATSADITYTTVTVNNLNGNIVENKREVSIAPRLYYSQGLGYSTMFHYEFNSVQGSQTYFKDISIKAHYNGQLNDVNVSSGRLTYSEFTEVNERVLYDIFHTSGTFEEANVPTDWFGWIVNSVNGFMQLQILPNVTLWTLFYGVLGLLLALMIMRKFAGG